MDVSASPANINLCSKTEKRPADDEASGSQNFLLMDSVYKAAVEGDIDKFKEHANILDQILSPSDNTILHIHITARPKTAKPNSFWNIGHRRKPEEGIHRKDFVRGILELCPHLLWTVNSKDEALLHLAARHGHGDIVNDLIAECRKPVHKNVDPEKGVSVKRLMLGMTNKANDTSLHEAVRYNNVDVVKILTREDPDLTYDANIAGETPLYLAAERGYKDVVENILFTCKSPAAHGPMGRTALHAAVICNDIEMTKMLLDCKGTALTSKPDEKGWLPLHLAAHFGYDHILKELLNTDKSAAYKADNEGKTALHVAAGRGKVYVMQELMQSCPGCCEQVDNRGWNVFHFALNSKNKNAVELLLNNPSLGNLLNEKNVEGNTPLLQLAASGYYMKSFVRHPKVDKLAFDHQNRNAANIISSKFLIWPKEVSFLRCLRSINGKCGRRQIDPRGGKRKDEEGNTVCDKSNNGNEKEKRQEVLEKYMNKGKDSHLLVAALIATVAFTAGITLPGGYIDEKGPYLGAAALTRSRAFQAFVVFNTTAMIFSSCAVFIHLFVTLMKNKRKEFQIWSLSLLFIMYAMLAMVLAFLMGTYAVLYRAKELAISTCAIGGMFFLVYAYFKPLVHLRNILTRVLVLRLARKLRSEFRLFRLRRWVCSGKIV